MKDNFAFCLKEVLKHEGLWADHPKDPGGATMKGITIGTYGQWKGRKVTKDELRAISDAEVAAIYKRNYWDKVRGDDLPGGLDFVAFDAAVNSGPARGAKWLQQALGVSADGKIGPATVAASLAQYAPAVIERAIGFRLAFLKSLKTWPTFGKGWGRRVEDVRVKALTLAKTEPVKSPPVTRPAPHVTETPKIEHEAPAKPAPASVKKPSTGIILALGGVLALFYAAWEKVVAWVDAAAKWVGL